MGTPDLLSINVVAAIVVAAGSGSRFGAASNKVLVELAGQPLWQRSLDACSSSSLIRHRVLVIRKDDRAAIEPLALDGQVHLVVGGEQRSDSVLNALRFVQQSLTDVTHVAIHDAARPLVPAADVQQVLAAGIETGAAILASPVRGTLKKRYVSPTKNRNPCSTVDRSELWEALTPQVFSLTTLLQAYQRHRGRPATDDAELVERAGTPVMLVHGSAENIKITQPEDLLIAEAILSRRINHHV